ncbi:DsbA family oxidoreductase [Streptomyces corynorhini]|uniref:DsbA family oxidoreductase n=1 Tax=Streptomyces corynorhini TaxID=2282652 RepID=A0A370B0M1_9ACTN|nr:DsbA family oxidoreductase [Streptomyces corynorhini]RDG35380.1 DsbA family oxidoreductase [Streptomyces corynorhini]
MRVEIWGDVPCPWCYIGKARFEKALAGFAHRDDIEVVHRSFELEPERRPGDNVLAADIIAANYGQSLEQVRGIEEMVRGHAHGEGLPYRTEGRDQDNSFDIHRLLHLAKARGRQNELLDLVYRANFAEERSVYDPETLVALAVEAGLAESEAREVLADRTAYARAVRDDEREAAELGATGVPFFVLDRRFGVSGAQPVEVLARALEQAWQSRTVTALTPIGATAGGTGTDGAAVCDADGACEVPGAVSAQARGDR